MAKRNSLHPGWLMFIAAVLLTAGWLMKSFPVFIFAGLAPLLAITDQIQNEERIWDRAELVLIALSVAYLAAHVFEMRFLVISMAEAITMTLSWLGYSFVRQRLGAGLVNCQLSCYG